MLTNAYEWLRAADPSPDNEMVNSRTNAVRDLKKRIVDSPDINLLLGTLTAAVGGCEKLGESSPVFSTLLECVRTQSPAFPSAISENSVHLRVVCCLVLGELVSSNSDCETQIEERLAASLLVSGLGNKPKDPGHHLDRILKELKHAAQGNLQRQAIELRSRANLDWTQLEHLEKIVNESSKFNEQLLTVVKELLTVLQKQHQSDREELEVMWWLYNGYSERIKSTLQSKSPFLAAMAIGCELADRITAPAMTGLYEMAGQAALKDRKAADIKAKPIEKILTEFGESGRKLLVPTTKCVCDFVRSNGTLCPLSWLSLRLEESGRASGWEGEFHVKTGLASGDALTPGELANQVFAECQSLKIYQASIKGEE